MAKAVIQNPSAVCEDPKALEWAGDLRALGLLLDSTNKEYGDSRDSLVKFLIEETVENLVAKEEVVGTYKVHVNDEDGALEGIVEVPLSVDTRPLDPEEQVTLKNLDTKTHSALFETKASIVNGDAAEVQKYLAGLNLSQFSNILNFSGGKVSVTIGPKDALGIPGMKKEAVTVPQTSFFGRLKDALEKSSNRTMDLKVMSEWITKRIKASVKIGNRS